MSDAETGRDHVTSLERGLAVLEILAANPAGLTLTETAEKAGLTRAGARRFLLTLVATGYAVQAGRNFSLSPRLLAQARIWLHGVPLWTFAEPFMRKTAAKLHESCSAAILSGEDMVYVARVPGPRIIAVDLQVGAHLPAHCTAMGRVLLSGLKQGEIETFLTRATITQRTPKTTTDRTLLAAIIAKVRADDFAIVDEELEIGLRSIAVPLRDRSNAIIAAINVSTQTSRHSPADMETEILPILRQMAQRISDFFVVQ
ncbi:IclR family transcriptional regulator C-terminal domain-containing protein [Aminobacter sp. AP02]|uniref:IclR family transcriptional regulator domain-containing protein n=1 Tax=Aminobacter sp. AP02 TaxID=2135737 RepID=UPI000D6D6931|nr:IclR family transcriptional regulator C-terminal domain-containing protein [Aminobacter sp. AP02]PWK65360.1 IclR family transcriptional regulator [Aminobacter sp. AP02]